MSNSQTHTLVVAINPDPDSLTQQLAAEIAAAVSARGATAELANLCHEGFDPRWTISDRRAYQGRGPVPSDVVAEQRRLDRATDLVLVFPVYWWSLPAVLKGWIDRVFINGWAFDVTDGGEIVPRLQTLRTHAIAIAGSDAGVYHRHGYEQALRTQLAHGVLDFCGSPQGAITILHDSEEPSGALRPHHVDRTVGDVTQAVIAGPRTDPGHDDEHDKTHNEKDLA